MKDGRFGHVPQKNLLIGLAGFLVTLLLIFLILHSKIFPDTFETISFLLLLLLLLFFVGFAIGGWIYGIPLALLMAVLSAVKEAPASIRGPLWILFLGALFVGSRLIHLFPSKKPPAGDFAGQEEAQEENQALEALERSIFHNGIYLIKPKKFQTDVTYKGRLQTIKLTK